MDRRVIEGDESMDLGVDNDGNDDEEEEHNQAVEAAAAEEGGAMFRAAIQDRPRDDEEEEHNQALEAAAAEEVGAMFMAAIQDRLRAQEAASDRLEEHRNLRERLARNAERVLAIAERSRDRLEEELNPRRAGSRVERVRAAAHSAAGLPHPANAAAEAPPNEEPSLLEQLMSRIHIFLSGEEEMVIDEEQARSVLEASAGDLDIAASLYCDHYFATIASRRNARRSAEDNEETSPRRVRRRLEEQLEEPVAGNEEGIEEEAEEPAPEAPDVPPNMPPPDLPGRLVAWAQPQDHAEGAPVSDDEGPQRPSHRSRRCVNFRRRGPEGRNVDDNANIPAIGPPLRNISNSVEQPSEEAVQSRRNHAPAKNEDKNILDDEDFLRDFIIDDDWIFHEKDTAPPVRPPVAVLWGAPSPPSQSSCGNDDNDPPEAGGGAHNLHNNIIAEDEDGDDAAPSPRPGICRTWRHLGFSSSTCCTGLVVTKPPPDEEVSLSHWSQNGGSRKIAPPPYHCRGLTALLSVVTALIYSGASIQGPTVNCNAARKSFAELSESERKREFDSRLVDALSSLLFIAAQASVERKKRALAKSPLLILPPVAGDGDKQRQQSLRRKLRLCLTCRWEDDIGTGDGIVPEGQTVQIASSYTSIEDIRSYVLSAIRSFTKKGGCALFLETIIRIHGKSCVERMLRHARRKASMPETKVLIECVCAERQKKLQQMSVPSDGASIQSTLELLDHSCTSIELISLLLTGEVHSTFQGWSTAGLGIGILSNKQGELGRQLMRPEKPVWILRGDTCYSVVWLDGSKEESKNIARTDRPGTVFRLFHWHCWFGDRHKSSMRVITARGEWTPPVTSTAEADSSCKKTVAEQIVARRRERSHVVSSDEQDDDEVPSESHITREEIDRVKVHRDDEKYYPNNYRQWRFDLGKTAPDTVDTDMKMGPVGVDREHWTPYFRLDSRQRMVVEMKVSPKINRILWTRWPGATIDRFTPDGEEPPVV